MPGEGLVLLGETTAPSGVVTIVPDNKYTKTEE